MPKKIVGIPKNYKKVSSGESVLRGLIQGASLGLSDEVVAIVKTSQGKGKFKDIVEEERTLNRIANASNPALYYGADAAASLIPLGRIARKVTGLKEIGAGSKAISALKSSGLGVTAGLGYSDTDDTKAAIRNMAIGGLIAGGADLALGALPKGSGKTSVQTGPDAPKSPKLPSTREEMSAVNKKVKTEYDKVVEKAAEKYGVYPSMIHDIARDSIETAGPKSTRDMKDKGTLIGNYVDELKRQKQEYKGTLSTYRDWGTLSKPAKLVVDKADKIAIKPPVGSTLDAITATLAPKAIGKLIKKKAMDVGDVVPLISAVSTVVRTVKNTIPDVIKFAKGTNPVIEGIDSEIKNLSNRKYIKELAIEELKKPTLHSQPGYGLAEGFLKDRAQNVDGGRALDDVFKYAQTKKGSSYLKGAPVVENKHSPENVGILAKVAEEVGSDVPELQTIKHRGYFTDRSSDKFSLVNPRRQIQDIANISKFDFKKQTGLGDRMKKSYDDMIIGIKTALSTLDPKNKNDKERLLSVAKSKIEDSGLFDKETMVSFVNNIFDAKYASAAKDLITAFKGSTVTERELDTVIKSMVSDTKLSIMLRDEIAEQYKPSFLTVIHDMDPTRNTIADTVQKKSMAIDELVNKTTGTTPLTSELILNVGKDKVRGYPIASEGMSEWAMGDPEGFTKHINENLTQGVTVHAMPYDTVYGYSTATSKDPNVLKLQKIDIGGMPIRDKARKVLEAMNKDRVIRDIMSNPDYSVRIDAALKEEIDVANYLKIMDPEYFAKEFGIPEDVTLHFKNDPNALKSGEARYFVANVLGMLIGREEIQEESGPIDAPVGSV